MEQLFMLYATIFKSLAMIFKLYPDCKLVYGKSRDAIYDLTRNSVYIVPHEMSKYINKDNVVDLGSCPTDKQKEFIAFLKENELGRFNMPTEIVALSDEYISPAIISNAIIDIGKSKLPLLKIAMELSDLVCESVFLRFMIRFSFDYIISCSKKFMSQSMRSIEIGLQYEDGIENYIGDLIKQIPLCTRIIIVNAPFTGTNEQLARIPIRYVQKGYSCGDNQSFNYSVFSNANLNLFLESKRYNNCLNKKIVIDQYGDIKNCPNLTETFGNVKDTSLYEVVDSTEFRKLWDTTKDYVEKCCDCEVRYACQHCIFASNQCSYNVYSD